MGTDREGAMTQATGAEDAAPRHGDPGDRPGPPQRLPAGLTVAVSREVGARGASVAARAGRKLGWPVYTQDQLEYLAQEGPERDRLFAEAPAGAVAWATAQYERLRREERLGPQEGMGAVARLMLVLAAAGDAVLVGRGAGYLLPAESTLHVRVVAPATDRAAYLGQWLRLPPDAADHERQAREARRADFVAEHFRRHPGDLDPFDIVLNTSRLGEEGCAELIVQAVRAKLEHAAARRPGALRDLPELPELSG
jgi:hypothetical protein